MKIKIESGFLPKFQHHFFRLGSEYKEILIVYRIIVTLFVLTASNSTQDRNSIFQEGSRTGKKFSGLDYESRFYAGVYITKPGINSSKES
jgi:hypothetical protein